MWDLQQQQLVDYAGLMCPSRPLEPVVMLPVFWPVVYDVTSCDNVWVFVCVCEGVDHVSNQLHKTVCLSQITLKEQRADIITGI